jgi:hypothetical protein
LLLLKGIALSDHERKATLYARVCGEKYRYSPLHGSMALVWWTEYPQNGCFNFLWEREENLRKFIQFG